MRALAGALVGGMLIAGLTVPAGAAQTVVVNGLPDGTDNVLAYGVNCADPTQPFSSQPTFALGLTSDPTYPVGDRMIGFLPQAAVDAFGPGIFTYAPSTFDVLSVRVDSPNATGSGLAVVYYYPNGSGDPWYVGHAALSPPQDWSTVDASGLSYSWVSVTAGSATPAGSSGLADFVNANGGDDTGSQTIFALVMLLFGCDGQRFWFDDLQYGPSGDVTTVDFEGYLSTVAIDSSKSKITAGSGVKLDGTFTIVGNPFPVSTPLTLLAKPFGSSTWTEVGTAPADYGSGPPTHAQLVDHPTTETTYKWVLADDPKYSGSESPEFTVKVATKVTAKLVDSTLAKGQKLVLKGRTVPAKAGSTIYLQRQVGGHWEKIGHALVQDGGKYVLKNRVTSTGTWKVRAYIPKGDGNLAGHSPSRSATVS